MLTLMDAALLACILTHSRWLVKARRNEKALKVLARLRRSDVDGVQEELNEIQLSISGEAGGRPSRFVMWKKFLRWKMMKRQVHTLVLYPGFGQEQLEDSVRIV